MPTSHTPITEPLYRYLQDNSLREPAILQELREETKQYHGYHIQALPEIAQFLAFLIKLMRAKQVLELGTYTGYSALAMALALPDSGRLIACDISKWSGEIAEKFWQKAGVADKINLRLQPALESLQQLLVEKGENFFDFIFIDADKANYPAYYEECLKLLRVGGLMVLDNMFREGKIIDFIDSDKGCVAIDNLNKQLHHDERVELSMLAVGDGLTLIVKR